MRLIRAFFEEGGCRIQFNVVSADELRRARANPERYRDLVVRVAGYSAFFVDLGESIREDIVECTEMRFGG